MDDNNYKSGFVAVIGKPNVGKSTLLNKLVGAKISIVSDKPQTTRDRIMGILSKENFQIVFVDTPGLIMAQDKLNECLVAQAVEGLKEVDLIYHLVDPRDKDTLPPEVEVALKKSHAPKLLLINKIDLFEGRNLLQIGLDIESYDAVVSLSALKGEGLDELLKLTLERLPFGPQYYDDDVLSDRDERFIVQEIVREKAYLEMSDEIPYSIATQVEEFTERSKGKTFIRVVIYVERDSQKGMVIGKSGVALKNIGRQARPEIEELLGGPVYLELWVKVRKNWRKKDHELRNFGYKK